MSWNGRYRRAAAAGAVLLLVSTAASARSLRWGYHGHEIAGRAAATALPAELPLFFRSATEQLAYLNPEPDRWRGDGFRELNEAMRYDHYIDMEVIPDTVLAALDRFQYLLALKDSGIANPARDAGLLPFRIVELQQRLVVEWRLWRRETDPAKRRMIEERILNDAGILGHYVTDGANPHHTSVHHNGWAAGYPNPRNFTTQPGFHGRFESAYVETHIQTRDLLPHMNPGPHELTNVRAAVLAFLGRSHARLERLYELDQQESFGPATTGAAHRDFAIERLVAGANMLRDLWWSAWRQSATSEPQR
ncbi:MAG TPA: hypothetical protein VMN60_06050 [Longimicrobiales bacterium]|nr:hypothetical protein [Longimicrobiales bacterium]